MYVPENWTAESLEGLLVQPNIEQDFFRFIQLSWTENKLNSDSYSYIYSLNPGLCHGYVT